MRFTRGNVVIAAIAALAGLAVPSATAAASGAPPPSWPQARYNAAAAGYNPHETQLSAHNVSKLVTRAVAPLGQSYAAAAPVVADGMVFITAYSIPATSAELEAFPESCGAPHGLSCSPVWTATVGDVAPSSVAVADGKVFVNTEGGPENLTQMLSAYSVHCGTGGASCSPIWTATFHGRSYESVAPTVAGGVVYVPVGKVGRAFLNAYPVNCSTHCHPLWRGTMVDGAEASAAVGDGYVFVTDYDAQLYAFKVGCARGGNLCSPAWSGSVGENGPRGPAVDDGLVFVGSQNGDLYAFNARGCGTVQSACPPVWVDVTARLKNILADPAVAYGLVFVTDYGNGTLYAFPEHCASSSCPPVWKAFLARQDLSDPAVANGVVYVSEGSNAKNVGIDAFSVHCATGGGTCTPLWHGTAGYYIPSGPAVAGGELWAGSGPINGPANLYAFGLPVPHQSSASPGEHSTSPGASPRTPRPGTPRGPARLPFPPSPA